MPLPTHPCYSARLLKPFLDVLGDRLPGSLREQLEAYEPERRLHATYVHSLLECAARLADDPAIGLAASELTVAGDGGMFDFLMTSAPTAGAALELARTHVRLLSDVHELSLMVRGSRAFVRIHTRCAAPRAADDFVAACLLRNHVLRWHPDAAREVEVWLQHAAPQDLKPYRRALGELPLHFSGEQSGIGFPSWLLGVPLRKRDRRLHAVLRRAAETELAKLPERESTSELVSRALRTQLGDGSVSMAGVGRALRLHPRTLSRLLAREGTNFQVLVARARKDAALHWLSNSELTLVEVARLSGFQSKAPFHRSFRRWTGETPQSYRRKQLGELAPLL